jgi:predicted peroxiredoxin
MKMADISREDFIKTVGVGLGAAVLGGMMATPGEAAQGEGKKYIVTVTSGGNNPNRAILSLLMAWTALDKGYGSVHVWMTLEGAELAVKGKAERIESPIFKKFGSAAELMQKLKGKGATFGVCPPCAEYAGAIGGEKFDFVDKQGADWLMKSAAEAVVAWM